MSCLYIFQRSAAEAGCGFHPDRPLAYLSFSCVSFFGFSSDHHFSSPALLFVLPPSLHSFVDPLGLHHQSLDQHPRESPLPHLLYHLSVLPLQPACVKRTNSLKLQPRTLISGHISQILTLLHWPSCKIQNRIENILLIYKALNGQAPAYLKNLTVPYYPTWTLHSQDKGLLSQSMFLMKMAYIINEGTRCFHIYKHAITGYF